MKNWNWKPIVAGIALLGVLATFYGTIRADMRGIRTDMRVEMQGVRAEISALRSDVQAEIQDLREEIHTLRSDMRADIQGLRAEMRTDIQGLRAEMRALHAVEASPPAKATGEQAAPASTPATTNSAPAPHAKPESAALFAAAREMPCVRSPHRLARYIAAVTLWYNPQLFLTTAITNTI